jgi:hypothetical protein
MVLFLSSLVGVRGHGKLAAASAGPHLFVELRVDDHGSPAPLSARIVNLGPQEFVGFWRGVILTETLAIDRDHLDRRANVANSLLWGKRHRGERHPARSRTARQHVFSHETKFAMPPMTCP